MQIEILLDEIDSLQRLLDRLITTSRQVLENLTKEINNESNPEINETKRLLALENLSLLEDMTKEINNESNRNPEINETKRLLANAHFDLGNAYLESQQYLDAVKHFWLAAKLTWHVPAVLILHLNFKEKYRATPQPLDQFFNFFQPLSPTPFNGDTETTPDEYFFQGLQLLSGLGTPQDLAEASHHIQISALNGNEAAQSVLERFYRFGWASMPEGEEDHEAAIQHNAMARFQHGLMLHYKGIAENRNNNKQQATIYFEQAEKHLKYAANLGFHAAQLSILYHNEQLTGLGLLNPLSDNVENDQKEEEEDTYLHTSLLSHDEEMRYANTSYRINDPIALLLPAAQQGCFFAQRKLINIHLNAFLQFKFSTSPLELDPWNNRSDLSYQNEHALEALRWYTLARVQTNNTVSNTRLVIQQIRQTYQLHLFSSDIQQVATSLDIDSSYLDKELRILFNNTHTWPVDAIFNFFEKTHITPQIPQTSEDSDYYKNLLFLIGNTKDDTDKLLFLPREMGNLEDTLLCLLTYIEESQETNETKKENYWLVYDCIKQKNTTSHSCFSAPPSSPLIDSCMKKIDELDTGISMESKEESPTLFQRKKTGRNDKGNSKWQPMSISGGQVT